MNQARAIETVYRGYRFRSRLEARWAVYFDAMGFPWEYEREGYNLGDGLYYLPDFWLPQVRMWAEVKSDVLSDDEYEKVRRLVRGTKFPCLMLTGPPAFRSYYAVMLLEPGDHPTAEQCDYVLSNYHDYPRDEHRFYGAPSWNLCIPGDDEAEYFDDVRRGVEAACSARFEHGESPNPKKASERPSSGSYDGLCNPDGYYSPYQRWKHGR